jgi:hypothetical protein
MPTEPTEPAGSTDDPTAHPSLTPEPNGDPMPVTPDPTPSPEPTADRAPVTLLTLLIDRSGSMEPLRGAVVEGANELLRGLEPRDRVTIVQFDTQAPYEVIVDGLPAAEIPPLEYAQYQPRGGTPLLDAVGRAIAATTGRAREVEVLTGVRPTVVLGIVTDGYENSSVEYTAEQIRRLIGQSREDGWTVTYAGIGMGDAAFAEAARLGIDRAQSSSVPSSRAGTHTAFAALCVSIGDARDERRRSDAS